MALMHFGSGVLRFPRKELRKEAEPEGLKSLKSLLSGVKFGMSFELRSLGTR